LKPAELETLHAQCRQVLEEATETLRGRMGKDIHKQEGSRLSNGAQQGRPAMPQVRRKRHSIKRQPAHHQLLPPLPTWFANSQLIHTRLHQLLSDYRYNRVNITLDYPFQA